MSQSELSRSIEKLGAERDWESVWKLIDDAWAATTTEPDTASMQQLIEHALAKKDGRQAVKLAQKLSSIISRNRLAANAITDEWIDTVLCSAVSLTSGLESSKNHPFVDFTFALFLIDVTPGEPRLDREQSRVLRCVNRLLASNSVRGAAGIKAELNAVTDKYVVPLETDSKQSAQGPKWTHSRLKHGDKLPYPELKKWYIDAVARFEIPTIKNISQLLTKAQKHGDHEFWEAVVCQDFPKLMSGLESTGLAKTDRLFKYYKKVVWSLAIRYLTVFKQQKNKLGEAYMTDSGVVKTKERIKFWLEKWEPARANALIELGKDDSKISFSKGQLNTIHSLK
ncbi:hypothetical protein GGH12_001787 [Coemansia sp. RSA 1822]|nr:hypothetical protein GGH12_001787 [Coemansia sp. RSA 1822]